MATELPSTRPAHNAADPDRPKGVALPLGLLAILLAGLAAASVWGIFYVQNRQAQEAADSPQSETHFVFRRLTQSVTVLGREFDAGFVWLPILGILGLLMTIALVYAIWQYVRDSRAVGPFWAAFMGMLRCATLLLLGLVFLLPALQRWDKSEQFSKILLMIDISGSMHTSDALPDDAGKPLPTRIDQVAEFLAKDDNAFLRNIIFEKDGKRKNPVTLYVLGSRLDEDTREFNEKTPLWSAEEWGNWLRFDVKMWLLDGLGDNARAAVKDSPGYETAKVDMDWANRWLKTWEQLDRIMDDANLNVAKAEDMPEELKKPADEGKRKEYVALLRKLTKEDRDKLKKKRDGLARRIEMKEQMLTSTNLGDSTLNGYNREANQMLSGLVLISDGQANMGPLSENAQQFRDLKARAKNARTPLFAVNVGERLERVQIILTDLQAPDQAPPDDAFPVRVEVDGPGLADQPFVATLDIYKPGQTYRAAEDNKPAMSLPLDGKFEGKGGVPHGQVEFVIDPRDPKLEPLTVTKKDAEGKPEGKPELEEGEYRFVARIPKAKGEAFPGKEHVSETPAVVHVVKRPLRILLFAGGPTREYQFCRRLFVNEMDKKRMEVCIHLQVGMEKEKSRVQDVPQERMLSRFPDRLVLEGETQDDKERFYNLAQYDVVIAYDPDWTQLERSTLVLLQNWVQEQGGGLVFVAGPVNTFHLVKGANFEKFEPLLNILPVRLEDSRIQGLGVDRQTTDPWRLNFPVLADPNTAKDYEFLKLDEAKSAQHAWNEFYGEVKGDRPERGFHSFYPVKKVKETAIAVATFSDPRTRIVTDQGKSEEHPFLVAMRAKGGKVVYVGGDGMWRLRLFKQEFHERFWGKLARYATDLTRKSRRGILTMDRKFVIGAKPINPRAQLRDALNNPMPMTTEARIRIIPPPGVELKKHEAEIKLEPDKEGIGSGREFAGWFQKPFRLTTPGKYRVELPIPGSLDVLRHEFQLSQANPEMDNTGPNPVLLYHIASTVGDLQVNEQQRKELRARLWDVKPAGMEKASPGVEAGPEPHLFFDLKTASMIPEYLTTDRKVQRNRGQVEDLWAEGFNLPWNDGSGKPFQMSWVLALVVGLLSAEWLTRKLLKLA